MTQSELYTYARRLVNATANDWAESDLVVDLNDALADLWVRIKAARGVLEYDDSNYTDLPSSTFNLTANTAAYKVTVDQNSNEIITIHKVQVLDGNSKWVDVPRNKIGEGSQSGLLDTSTDTKSVPDFYYEVGATVYFSPIPSTSRTSGVKVWYDRGPKNFTVGGTTFVPGIPAVYHKTLGEKASYTYAVSKGMNAAVGISSLIEMGHGRIDEYEKSRRRDEVRRITPASHSTR